MLFGAEPVLDEDEAGGQFHHTVFALDGGMLLGLHSHQGRESGERFSELRTGLDHAGSRSARAPSWSGGRSS